VRIALLGPVAWRTPPHDYGPWERVTGLLAEGLSARGVDVTLFATLDSVTSARLSGVCPRGYADDPAMDGRVWEALHVSHALARSAEFDLVHNHLDWLPLAFAEHWRAPLLTTVHGFSGPGIVPAYTSAVDSDTAVERQRGENHRRNLELTEVEVLGVDPVLLPAALERPIARVASLVFFGGDFGFAIRVVDRFHRAVVAFTLRQGKAQ